MTGSITVYNLVSCGLDEPKGLHNLNHEQREIAVTTDTEEHKLKNREPDVTFE